MGVLVDRSVIFSVPLPGGGERVEVFNLSDGEMLLVEVMTLAGLTADHFLAYLVQTYKDKPMALSCAKESETFAGAMVKTFLGTIPQDPRDPRWDDMIERFYFLRHDGTVVEGLTPEIMALIIWIKGEDFLSFRNWHQFTDAAQMRPISVAESLGRTHAQPSA